MDLSYINTQSQILNAEETTKREQTKVQILDPSKFRCKVDRLKHRLEEMLNTDIKKKCKKSIVKTRNKGVASTNTWNFMAKLKMNLKSKQDNNEVCSSTGFENHNNLT